MRYRLIQDVGTGSYATVDEDAWRRQAEENPAAWKPVSGWVNDPSALKVDANGNPSDLAVEEVMPTRKTASRAHSTLSERT